MLCALDTKLEDLYLKLFSHLIKAVLNLPERHPDWEHTSHGQVRIVLSGRNRAQSYEKSHRKLIKVFQLTVWYSIKQLII